MRALAQFVSGVFHPLLIPSIAMYLLFNFVAHFSLFVITDEGRDVIYWVVFLATFIFPVIGTFLMYRKGVVTDINISQRQERILPLLFTLVMYTFVYILFARTHLPVIIQLLTLTAAIAVLLGMAITFFWKISIHMLGWGGVTGAFYGLALLLGLQIQDLILGLFIVSTIIAWARLRVNAHSEMQVAAGFVLGFTSGFVPLLFVG